MKRIFSILMAAMMLLSGCAGQQMSRNRQEPSNSETAEALEQTPEGRTVVDHDGIEVDIPEQIDRIAVGNIGPMASVLTLFLGSGESIGGHEPNVYVRGRERDPWGVVPRTSGCRYQLPARFQYQC